MQLAYYYSQAMTVPEPTPQEWQLYRFWVAHECPWQLVQGGFAEQPIELLARLHRLKEWESNLERVAEVKARKQAEFERAKEKNREAES